MVSTGKSYRVTRCPLPFRKREHLPPAERRLPYASEATSILAPAAGRLPGSFIQVIMDGRGQHMKLQSRPELHRPESSALRVVAARSWPLVAITRNRPTRNEWRRIPTIQARLGI